MKQYQKGSIKVAIILILLLLIIGLSAYIFLREDHTISRGGNEFTLNGASSTDTDNTTGWKINLDTVHGYSILYPNDFIMTENHTRDLSNDVQVQGVSFAVPEMYATGTNLSKDSNIAVEISTSTSACDPSQFITGLDASQIQTESVNGINFTKATSSDAGAGNFYEETVYATASQNACIGIRLFLHSTNVGNYPEGTVREYDREIIRSIYNSMVSSFRFANR